MALVSAPNAETRIAAIKLTHNPEIRHAVDHDNLVFFDKLKQDPRWGVRTAAQEVLYSNWDNLSSAEKFLLLHTLFDRAKEVRKKAMHLVLKRG